VSSETIIHSQPGVPLNEATLKADVDWLRSLGEFDDLRVNDEADRSGFRTLISVFREKTPSRQPAPRAKRFLLSGTLTSESYW
jgi:hypothetical protein